MDPEVRLFVIAQLLVIVVPVCLLFWLGWPCSAGGETVAKTGQR